MTRPQRAPKQIHLEGLPAIHPNAAGIDIGANEMVVAVPSDRDPQPVRAFPTFTWDLQTLVAWLLACRIDTVALESTGVYWIPIYELLEQHGIIPYLVNAWHVKPFPAARVIGMMRNGSRNSMRWDYCTPRFGPMATLRRSAPWCAIGPS